MKAEALLAHAGFVRALARGLLGDEDRADDVVQDTLVTALERPPRSTGALRSWLARVAVNRVRERMPRPAATELEPGEQLSREATLRSVVDAVLALPEPYRKAVIRRYYEDLSPKQIAEREGLPLETVRTHLRRARSRLRERLDREHGGWRSRWSLFSRRCSRSSSPSPR